MDSQRTIDTEQLDEFPDDDSEMDLTVFPNLTKLQVDATLVNRISRLKGPDLLKTVEVLECYELWVKCEEADIGALASLTSLTSLVVRCDQLFDTPAM